MGLCDGGDKSPKVFLSPRGASTAAELSERYESVQVCADNQVVVDRSEVVMIAVRRQDRHEALVGLRVDDDKLVVNVMAGVGIDDLRQILPPTPRWCAPPSARARCRYQVLSGIPASAHKRATLSPACRRITSRSSK